MLYKNATYYEDWDFTVVDYDFPVEIDRSLATGISEEEKYSNGPEHAFPPKEEKGMGHMHPADEEDAVAAGKAVGEDATPGVGGDSSLADISIGSNGQSRERTSKHENECADGCTRKRILFTSNATRPTGISEHRFSRTKFSCSCSTSGKSVSNYVQINSPGGSRVQASATTTRRVS